MNKFYLLIFSFLVSVSLLAQTKEQIQKLKEFADFLKIEDARNYQKAIELAIKKGWQLQIKVPHGGVTRLTGVSFNGMPEYTATDSNVGAAGTTGASTLWNGGSTGLNLSGSSAFLNGKIAVWDGGAVLGGHQELSGKITSGDGAASLSDHATHVTGTIVAKGTSPLAKGMLYNLATIPTYNFDFDNSEIASAASNLILSNHSYGSISGWRFNETIWEWWGEAGATEDYKFGYYDNKSRYWDSIAFLSPNYLIVKSAGNKRNENGPAAGTAYRRFNAMNQMVDAGAYDGSLSPNNSYDILPTYSNAKNILTVGAVGILSNGFVNSSSVAMSNFSSWGPTDDGRIKPDIVAAGVGLFSSVATSNTAYDTYSGTSMSSPNATGSLGLLQELYQKETATFLKSASLKGLAIHAADESGVSNGPDYQFGWGLLNVKKGSEVILGRTTKHRILENNLAQNATLSQNHISSGGEKLVATIVWTDPAASVETVNYLNNRTRKLVNDLDLRIVSGSGTEMPWKLDVFNPATPATKGDNNIDNVEKVEILNPIPGESYEIRVSHKGVLVNGSQNYSLLLSGVGGTAYCTSSPVSNSNTRINQFTFAGILRTNTGCTQYTNVTTTFGTVYPSQIAPFSVDLGTCGVNNNKICKIFIDWNSDGDFTDAGENVATSPVIANASIFTGNITAPGNLIIGSSTRVRVVVSETTDPATVTPCGSYSAGETLDASLKITAAGIDASAISVEYPENNSCATDFTYVAARVKNNGVNNITNVPAKAQIFDGATLVATLLDTAKLILQPNSITAVYFRTPFVSQAGKTYTIRVNTDVTGELIKTNDSITVTRNISQATTATITGLSGQLCNANQAILNATPSAGQLYWYTAATGGNPIATGNNVNTNNVPANRTYFIGVNEAKGTIGPANKNVLGAGTYVAFNANGQNITALSPTIIESLRMYIGTSGSIDITVKDVASGNVVAVSSFNVIATSSTPGSSVNDLNDQGIVLPVNLKIPAAGSYLLGATFNAGATAFRNNALNPNPYPYQSAFLMDMNNSNNGTGLTTYYWFYDLKVRALGCATTAARTTLIADAALNPTISQTASTLTVSETGTTYIWTKDGVSVPNSNTQSITITGGGAYVCTILKGGCIFTSPSFNAVFTSLSNINPIDVSFNVAPNPIQGKGFISFILPTKENVTMELVDATGKQIQVQQFVALANTRVSKEIKTQELASGNYFIRIKYDNKQIIKQVFIQ